MNVEDDVFGVFFFEEFPGGSDGKESACNAGEPREENGNPLEYSCLENPMDRGAWWIQRVRYDLVTECTHSGEETPQYALKDVQNVNKKEQREDSSRIK